MEDFDRRIVVREADVRDASALADAVRVGVAELGRLDIVVANAGIATVGSALELDEATWQTMIDVNLTGVWKTIKAAVPAMIAGGRGGSVILTSSAAGLRGTPNLAHYVAAKHGVVGLMRTLAHELAPYMIRVNTVNPTAVDTPMVMNDMFYGLVRPDLERPGSRRRGRGLRRLEHPARAVGRDHRHQQRRAVVGIGRGPVHHRRDAAGRCRIL